MSSFYVVSFERRMSCHNCEPGFLRPAIALFDSATAVVEAITPIMAKYESTKDPRQVVECGGVVFCATEERCWIRVEKKTLNPSVLDHVCEEFRSPVMDEAQDFTCDLCQVEVVYMHRYVCSVCNATLCHSKCSSHKHCSGKPTRAVPKEPRTKKPRKGQHRIVTEPPSRRVKIIPL